MNRNYLHDPDQVDPTEHDHMLQQLEQDLSVFRQEGEMPIPELPPRTLRKERTAWRIFSLGLAGSLLVASLLFALSFLLEPPASPYSVRSQSALLVNGEEWADTQRLPFDSVLQTTANGSYVMTVGNVGTATLTGESRLQILPPLDTFGDGRYRLLLDYGTLEVSVNAPAQAFLIETPWFQVWDLGCYYELQLDAEGNGSLAVFAGAVRWQNQEQSLRLDAGESVTIRSGQAQTN
jgi:hypothetical protein